MYDCSYIIRSCYNRLISTSSVWWIAICKLRINMWIKLKTVCIHRLNLAERITKNINNHIVLSAILTPPRVMWWVKHQHCLGRINNAWCSFTYPLSARYHYMTHKCTLWLGLLVRIIETGGGGERKSDTSKSRCEVLFPSLFLFFVLHCRSNCFEEMTITLCEIKPACFHAGQN